MLDPFRKALPTFSGKRENMETSADLPSNMKKKFGGQVSAPQIQLSHNHPREDRQAEIPTQTRAIVITGAKLTHCVSSQNCPRFIKGEGVASSEQSEDWDTQHTSQFCRIPPKLKGAKLQRLA